MLKCLLVTIFCVTTVVLGRSANSPSSLNQTDNRKEKKVSENFWDDFSYMYNIYQKCSKEDTVTCLKIKLVRGLENALNNAPEIKLMEGVKFISDETGKEPMNQKVQSEEMIKATLPRSLQDKEQTLNYMIFNKALAFLKSHTLQIKFPNSQELERSFDEERKKKDKKGSALIMIPLLLGSAVLPIAYGALALLAGKALIVSKLALVLASIIGIKKLLSGSSKESQHEVVVSSGGHGGGSGWGRDFDIAYGSYNSALKQKSKNS